MLHSSHTYVDCCSGICDGCQVEGEVKREIVDFALTQLFGPEKKCLYVKTENFQSQVNLNDLSTHSMSRIRSEELLRQLSNAIKNQGKAQFGFFWFLSVKKYL